MEKYSFTEENYLKAIFFLSHSQKDGVSTNSVAERLDTKAATVTDMLKRLSEKELLEYKPYKGALLTKKGREVAIRTVRKHRLWETFLVDKLDFGWDEVHEVAEQLEHIQSQKLTDRLDHFLNHPKYDPHGDPIPDKNGIFPQSSNKTLDHFNEGNELKIMGVKDSSPDFLQYLDKIGVSLGKTLLIKSVEKFDRSMLIIMDDKEHNLSAMVCKNIYVS